MQAEALDWFTRLQAVPADAALQARFEAWLAENPRHADAYGRIAGMWGDPAFGAAVERRAVALAPPAPQRRAGLTRRGWLAGGLAAALVLAVGGAHLSGAWTRLGADYATAVAERRTVQLPDGSRMILDGASAAAIDFDGDRRTVHLLEGEAYFDVVSDPARPFRAVGRFGEVEVTGTAFSVRLGEGADEVVLARGRVEVRALAGNAPPSALSPGDMVMVNRNGLSAVRKVDTERALAWLDGRLSFSRRPLGDVIEDVRRSYDGRIFILNGDVARREVSGSYRLDDPVLVIRSLAEAAGAQASFLPGGIIILR
ncbi:FecR family protein [Aquabacter sp. L1I39]|uniref:FecR family protein n=1 Tax=Aquabacter sp. L1I39 TaxID=2820278 RepID=UPI001FFCF05E|nr:FecR family protein [Aquabacter sp. L1I39]